MRKGETQVFITLWFLGFLFLMPLSGDGADLTISNVITGNGNMTLNGAMSATSFSGSGSGLTNLDPTKLSSGTANINISGNAATATTANSVAAGGVVTVGLADGAVTAGKLAVDAVTPDKIAFYNKVAIVALTGSNYADPVAAMTNLGSWCGTPSATNPCLMKIMPGVYDVGTNSVEMVPFVDIEGSGVKTTQIVGHGLYVVHGAANAELRSLYVENGGPTSGQGGYAYGIYIDNAFASFISDVWAFSQSSTTTNNYAIYNANNAQPWLFRVYAYAAHASAINRGIHSEGNSNIRMTNVTAQAVGGIYADAIRNENSSVYLQTVVAWANGGILGSYGLSNATVTPEAMTVFNSQLFGGTHAITNGSGVTIYVANTQISGGVDNSGTLKCVGAYDDTFSPLNAACQ